MIGLHFNKKELLVICKILDCLDGDLSKVLKASLTEQKQSSYYRPLLETKPEGIATKDFEKIIKNAIDYYITQNPWNEINDRIDKINASVIKPTKPEFNI